MANNGADVKPNQGVGATNTSTTTNTAENTVGTATPKQNGLAVLGKYVGVSATQTIVEYATFAILHLIGVPSQIANGIAVVCSATYNFVMNRNVTFKSSSNFTRSVALFVLLWIWNFTFSTLLIGWVLLDAILNIFPEKYTHWAVLGIMLLGWGTTLVWELPFSLSQGAVIVPYLYIGYLAKKNRWLDKPLPRRTLYILLGGTALTAVGALLAQSTDCISMGEWTLGPLSILLDAATGFLFIRLFMRLNRFTGPIAQGLQAIGRNSLNIFCIHTVELIAIPWYLFAAHFTDHPLRGMLLQNVIAFASIGLVCALLNLRRSWIVKASAARRQAQRRTPALSQH